MTSDEAKTALGEQVFKAYQFQYKDYSGWWNDLDRKAQGTITITGIILAASFAFVRQLDATTTLLEQVLLVGVVSTLLFALALSVLALTIYEVALPPGGEDTDDIGELGDSTACAEEVEDLVKHTTKFKKDDGKNG